MLDGEELHCSVLLPGEDAITAVELVIEGLIIPLDPVDAVYEAGAECGMGGRYLLYYEQE
jgi:hypothetical protein